MRPVGRRDYSNTTHRFFDDLVNICLTTACFTSAFLTYLSRPGTFAPGDRVTISGFRRAVRP